MSDPEVDEHTALADVDFPAPREDSEKSVVAAREYIRERSGATRDEILEGLSPEKSHQIGFVAAQLVGKLNDIERYREWWWTNVAEPGLRAFPDISQPDGRGREWRLNEDTDNQHDPKNTDQDTANLDTLYSTLADPTATPKAHTSAVRKLFAELAKGTEVGSRFVEPTSRLLTRPSLDVDVIILRCLTYLAQQHPEEVMESSSRITEYISLDDSSETAAATECVAMLVSHEPGPFVDLTPKMDALLDSDNDQIRTNAMYIVARLAREYPNEVKPLIPDLIADIDAASTTDQRNALSALGHITTLYPAAAKPAVEELIELTESTDDMIRANAIGVLADISKEHPEAVEAHVPRLIDLLDDDDEHVRGNAVSAVLHLGVWNREAVSDAVPGLIELLDDPSPVVRRNVCKALGNLNAMVAIEQLQKRAKSDSDEQVRKLAEWAVYEMS